MTAMDGPRSDTSSPPLPHTAGEMPQVQSFQEPFMASPGLRPQQAAIGQSITSPRRANSNAQRPPPLIPPGPIKDAVNSAFDDTPTTKQLDPDLIALVTQQVIEKLQNANIASVPPTPVQSQALPPQLPQQQQQHPPRSPTQSSTTSMPPKYTPPASPDRDRHDSAMSDEDVVSDPDSNYRKPSVESIKSVDSDEDRTSQTPRPTQIDPHDRLRRSQTSPKRPTDSDSTLRRRESATDSQRPSQQRKMSSHQSTKSAPQPSREDYPPGEQSNDEATTLEKIWGPLFDNGGPTRRLSQLLRGLALHLIEDCEPKNSLVVTPAKMLKFLDETKPSLTEEYPWQTIFGGKMACPSISIMYRKLLCQHHWVQNLHHEQPFIPSLTPQGFETFMTCMIQAHPDVEFERLAYAVKHMPVSNADDKTERFPKELSRRLLPAYPNVQAEQRLVASLAHESQLVPLRNSASMPPPPPSSAPPQQNYYGERQRKPYSSNSFSDAAVDDDDLDSLGPSIPIERERKPYSGREGAGRTYTSDEEWQQRQSQGAGRTYAAGREGGGRTYTSDEERQQRQSRALPVTNSVPGMPPQPHASYSRETGTPMDSRSRPPPPRDSRSRNRVSQAAMPTLNTYNKNSNGRPRSPTTNPYTRSDPVNINNGGYEYGSSMDPRNGRESYAGDRNRDRERERERDRDRDRDRERERDQDPEQLGRMRSRGQTNSGPVPEEDGRSGKPIPPRNMPSQTAPFDPSFASGPAPPVGSYNDRRRSMFVGGTSAGFGGGVGDGGTDGYGSFNAQPNNNQYQPPQNFGTSSRH